MQLLGTVSHQAETNRDLLKCVVCGAYLYGMLVQV